MITPLYIWWNQIMLVPFPTLMGLAKFTNSIGSCIALSDHISDWCILGMFYLLYNLILIAPKTRWKYKGYGICEPKRRSNKSLKADVDSSYVNWWFIRWKWTLNIVALCFEYWGLKFFDIIWYVDNRHLTVHKFQSLSPAIIVYSYSSKPGTYHNNISCGIDVNNEGDA